MWHLEVRWLICQGHRVEELIKHCMRRAKQEGARTHLLACLLTLLFSTDSLTHSLTHLLTYFLLSYSLTVDLLAAVARAHASQLPPPSKQAGLLMLQIPTGRRPRPFSPSVLVPVPEALRGRAIVYLREDLGFVCESGLDARAGWEAGGGRWMHELGVAFARLDPKGSTCPVKPLATPCGR